MQQIVVVSVFHMKYLLAVKFFFIHMNLLILMFQSICCYRVL